MIRAACISLAALAAATATPAAAQPDADDDDYLIVSFGVGPQLLPEYPGSKDYSLNPLFGGHVRREGEPLRASAPDDGFGISLTGRGGPIEIGPMIAFQRGRDPEDVGAPLPEVDLAVEPGLFVNFKLSEVVRFRAEARRGFGGHEGWQGDVGIDLFARPNPETIISIGPRLRLADDEFVRTYFGVTPAAAAATGLTAYNPGGGVHAVGAVFGITHQISRNFGVYAYAGYDRLIGDAADSPIVQRFGSPNQFSGGIAFYYSFRMRNPFR